MNFFKKLVYSFFCLAFCLSVNKSFAQIERFNSRQYISASGDTLRYRMLDPDNDPLRSTPLIIFLHGAGERGFNNEAQLKWGVMNFA
ncbi:MAG: phospholipase, partial [Bacteroidota bacterium]|nr:phospholipase [Bacteroidota bacterium]